MTLGAGGAATCRVEDLLLRTSNDRFKAAYPRNLRVAYGLATLLLALGFAFAPQIAMRPYHLDEPPIVLIDAPPGEPILSAPDEIQRPPVPEEIVFDNSITDDVEFAPTIPDVFGELPIAREAPEPTSLFRPLVEVQPELLSQPAPRYLEVARELELHGTVVVNVLVGPDGHVLQAVLAQGVHPLLDREALKAAILMTFRPGRQGDRAVPVWVTIPYTFSLY